MQLAIAKLIVVGFLWGAYTLWGWYGALGGLAACFAFAYWDEWKNGPL